MLFADIWLFVVHCTQTLSTNVEAIIVHLAQNQQIQNNIYNEIKSTLTVKNESDEFKQLEFNSSNVVKCPIFRAFVNEVIRLLHFFPRSLSHELTMPCKLSFRS